MGRHSLPRNNVHKRAVAGALGTAAAVSVLGAAPALAATAITVRGTDILSPGDSPEAIVPSIFAGYDVQPVDYAASPVDMDRSAREAAAAVGSAVDASDGKTIVAGFSQGAIAVAYEKQRLMALPPEQRPAAGELTFVTVGDPTGPQGIIRWLPGRVPVIGVQPVDVPETPYDTVIVNREYDGWADFPDRPWNVISTVNAVMGIVYVHGRYPELGPIDLDAVPANNVTETTNSLGGKTTTYLVPTNKLPIVQPLRDLHVPEPIVQAIEAPLKQVVDAGYARNDANADTTSRPAVRPSVKAEPTTKADPAASAKANSPAAGQPLDTEPTNATPTNDDTNATPTNDDKGDTHESTSDAA